MDGCGSDWGGGLGVPAIGNWRETIGVSNSTGLPVSYEVLGFENGE